MLKEHLPAALASSGRAPATALVPTIVSAMFVQAITSWLERDRPLSARQLATPTGQIAAAIITEADSWNDHVGTGWQ